MWHLVLVIRRWWLQSSWMCWIDLCQLCCCCVHLCTAINTLRCIQWTRFCRITLDVISQIILVFVWIVNVSDIMLVSLVLWNKRLPHLCWHFVLLIQRSRHSMHKRLLHMTCLMNLLSYFSCGWLWYFWHNLFFDLHELL